MKKYHFLLVTFVIFMTLSSCSKDNDPKFKSNYWIQQFKTAESFLGRSYSEVTDSLMRQGYKSDEACIFVNSKASQVEYVYGFESEGDKIISVNYHAAGNYNSLGDDITNSNVCSDFMSYLGSSYKSSIGRNFEFCNGLYEKNDDTSGEISKKDFDDIFSLIDITNMLSLSWLSQYGDIIYVNRYNDVTGEDYEFLMQFQIYIAPGLLY